MRTFSLLVFSTVYLYVSPFIEGVFDLYKPLASVPSLAQAAAANPNAKSNFFASQLRNTNTTHKIWPPQASGSAHSPQMKSDINARTKAFCYEVIAAQKAIGFVFELRDANDASIFTKSYTQIRTPNQALAEEVLTTKTDAFYSPQDFSYKNFVNAQLTQEVSGHIKKYKQELIADIKAKTGQKKAQLKKLSLPKGTTFHSQFTDLIFSKKKFKDLTLDQEVIVNVLDEKTGEMQSISSRPALQTEAYTLDHDWNGHSFSTTHTPDGQILKSYNPKQNLYLEKCQQPQVLLQQAQTQKTFKTLFADKETAILKTCCQL